MASSSGNAAHRPHRDYAERQFQAIVFIYTLPNRAEWDGFHLKHVPFSRIFPKRNRHPSIQLLVAATL